MTVEAVTLPCVWCGVTFTQRDRSQKFCSRLCRGRAWQAANREKLNERHRERWAANREKLLEQQRARWAVNREKRRPRPLPCMQCGELFEKYRSSQTYCSLSCARRAYRANPINRAKKRARELDRRGTLGVCKVDDCEADALRKRDGLCGKHATRMRRHGDTDTVKPSGPWQGDGAGYLAAHKRVHRARGKARAKSCVDCGDGAWDWSYNHLDPDEKTGPMTIRGATFFLTYSLDPGFYDPRCKSCHVLFDMSWKAGYLEHHNQDPDVTKSVAS